MTYLNWDEKDRVPHWNGGRRERCRWCGDPAFLIDEQGVPAHKVCAEREDRDRVYSIGEAPALDDDEWGAA